MVWARIDDQYPDHPKVTGLSDPAFRLHISAIAYASRYLTDGFVPLGQVRKLLPFSDDPSAVCDELVEAGLFEPADKGYVVHDYLSYNPSRAEIEEKRESDRLKAATALGRDDDMIRRRAMSLARELDRLILDARRARGERV